MIPTRASTTFAGPIEVARDPARAIPEPVTNDPIVTLLERVGLLEQKVKALETKPTWEYCGTWSDAHTFTPGQLVTSGGSLWYCHTATRAKPGTSHDWQLACKRGRDAR